MQDEGEEGQPHERVFTVVCKLGPKLVERGRGRSKKQAKRVAAYKMLQRIMVMMRNQENTEQQETDEVDASIEERLSNLSFTTAGEKQSVSLSDVCQMYKARNGKQLDLLRVSFRIFSRILIVKFRNNVMFEHLNVNVVMF